MSPGQLTLNELESALLLHLAIVIPDLAGVIAKLHVLSRKFTGVGCYTSFLCDQAIRGMGNRYPGIDAEILVPSLKYGLGAVVYFENDKLKILEIYSYDEAWDGTYEGFSLRARP